MSTSQTCCYQGLMRDSASYMITSSCVTDKARWSWRELMRVTITHTHPLVLLFLALPSPLPLYFSSAEFQTLPLLHGDVAVLSSGQYHGVQSRRVPPVARRAPADEASLDGMPRRAGTRR